MFNYSSDLFNYSSDLHEAVTRVIGIGGGGGNIIDHLGVCAAEPLLLRTHPDGAFLSIIFVAYE